MSLFDRNLSLRLIVPFSFFCYTLGMKSKQQTPLGYLMKLLSVSLRDLGDYLYVAQTSISKWKTGARTLRPESQYFAGIIEYFCVLARDPARGEKLRRLFQRLYPTQRTESEQETAACLRAFLGGKLLPSMALEFSLGEQGQLYATEFSVYSGEDGLTNALARLTAYLAAQQEPVTVSLLDRQASILRPLWLPALSRGHRVRLFVEDAHTLAYSGEMAPVLAHKNMELRLLPKDAPFPRQAFFCVAEHRLLLLGSAFPNQPRYTALYTDELTIAQYLAGFNSLWDATNPLFMNLGAEDVTAERLSSLTRTTIPERTDWLLPSLPHTTMSRNLLMEVLEHHGVSGRSWLRVLHFYDKISTVRTRLLIPVNALTAPQHMLPDLSLLAGTPIRLTDAQVRRHMLDTAALLRVGSRVELFPLQQDTPDTWWQTSLMTKRNAYAAFLDFASGCLRFTRHPEVLQGFIHTLDALTSQLTEPLRTSEYVAEMLERSALNL